MATEKDGGASNDVKIDSYETIYDLLDVPIDATNEEKEEATFRLIQKIGNDDPKQNTVLQRILNLIRSKFGLAQYDAWLNFGNDIQSVREEAEDLLRRDNPRTDRAIEILQDMLMKARAIPELRALLAEAFDRAGQTDRAKMQRDKQKKFKYEEVTQQELDRLRSRQRGATNPPVTVSYSSHRSTSHRTTSHQSVNLDLDKARERVIRTAEQSGPQDALKEIEYLRNTADPALRRWLDILTARVFEISGQRSRFLPQVDSLSKAESNGTQHDALDNELARAIVASIRNDRFDYAKEYARAAEQLTQRSLSVGRMIKDLAGMKRFGESTQNVLVYAKLLVLRTASPSEPDLPIALSTARSEIENDAQSPLKVEDTLRALKNLKKSYKNVYNLNPERFDQLIEVASETRPVRDATSGETNKQQGTASTTISANGTRSSRSLYVILVFLFILLTAYFLIAQNISL